METVYIFSPFESIWDTLDNFLTLPSGVLSLPFAMQNPRSLSIFGYVLKPKAVEGRFKTDNLDFFHSSEFI